MRVLHLADTHLGSHLRAWGAPREWHRSQDHLRVMAQALEPALRGEVDLVVHGGDLFDGRKPARAVVAGALELLSRVAARVPVVLLPGNHDPPTLLRTFRLPPPGLRVVDVPSRLRFGPLTIAAVPFRRTVRGFRQACAQAVGPGADALLIHQAVHGCRVPRFVFRVGNPVGTIGERDLAPGPRWAFAGHLHPRQSVDVGPVQVVYPGATVRTAASEGPAHKGYVLWEFGRQVRWRWVDLPDRGFTVVSRPRQLEALRPEQLVRIAWDADYAALFHGARARGAWVVGRGLDEPPRRRRERPPQQRLFPR